MELLLLAAIAALAMGGSGDRPDRAEPTPGRADPPEPATPPTLPPPPEATPGPSGPVMSTTVSTARDYDPRSAADRSHRIDRDSAPSWAVGAIVEVFAWWSRGGGPRSWSARYRLRIDTPGDGIQDDPPRAWGTVAPLGNAFVSIATWSDDSGGVHTSFTLADLVPTRVVVRVTYFGAP